MLSRVASIVLLWGAATPAFAQSANAIPEPSAIALFVLGVAGLVVGRSASRRGGPRDDA